MNIAIDLDGTIAEWEKGVDYSSSGNKIGKWIPGAKEAIDSFLEKGYGVIIHSCRATWKEGGGIESICNFLITGGYAPAVIHDSNGEMSITFEGVDDITKDFNKQFVMVWAGEGKPIASYYIDDRAIEFKGNWQEIVERI